MYKLVGTLVFSTLLSLSLSACNEPAMADTGSSGVVSSSASMEVAAGGRLLFFLNPNGRPCQMQDDIIKSIRSELEKKVTIQYVRTTVSSDRELFYRWGVRGLPSIILVDKNDKEVRRFSPGIQSPETLKSALGIQ